MINVVMLLKKDLHQRNEVLGQHMLVKTKVNKKEYFQYIILKLCKFTLAAVAAAAATNKHILISGLKS